MTIFYLPKQRETSSLGIPLAFAKLYFYKAGTTTDQTVYNNADLAPAHAHAQPVVADATGTFPVIYLDPNAPVDYRVQLKTVLNALVYDQDNYPKSGSSGTTIFSTQFRYDQTAAEAAASVTPLNKQYEEGNVFRYIDSTQHAFILGLNYAAQNGTLVATGIQNCLNVINGKRKKFPTGYYKTATGLTVQNNGIQFDCDEATNFFFDDSASPGSFFLTVGKAGGTTTGFFCSALNINLLTATANGVNVKNVTGSYWEYLLVSGYQPGAGSPVWDTRTNIGLKIESTGGFDCFFNVFNYLYLPHCIVGVKIPGGGISTRQAFNHVYYFGDASNGCTSAIAFDLQGSAYSTVDDVWLEQIGAAGFGFRMVGGGGGTAAVNWRVHDLVCDAVTTAISFASGTSENKFTKTTLAGAAVADASASNSGNSVETENAWDTMTISTATTTNKNRWLAMKQYDTSQSAFALLGGLVSSTSNNVLIGGGNAARNAATATSIYSSSNNTTLTGTEVVRIDFSTTAGDTCMMLWDVNKGTLSRVSVGANDSGGAGFKLLRVPN